MNQAEIKTRAGRANKPAELSRENRFRLKYQKPEPGLKIVQPLPTRHLKERGANLSQDDCEFLEHLNDKLEEQLAASNFSINRVAKSMYMSRSSFFRKIKHITGMSPNGYLKTWRLSKAAELLLRDEYPITEICFKTGFSSSSYFAKCFKARFGVLPKDYPNSAMFHNSLP